MSNQRMEIEAEDSCAEDVSDDEPKERYVPNIKSEQDFDHAWRCFKKITSNFLYTDVYDYHFRFWSELMDNVKLKENWKAWVVECTIHAIKTCPLTAHKKTVTWTNYVRSIYEMISKGELTLEQAEPVFEESRKKFGVVVHLAHEYWNMVNAREINLRKEYDWSDGFYLARALPRRKFQFTHPYIGIEIDWEALKGAPGVNFDLEDINQLTIGYFKIRGFGLWMDTMQHKLIDNNKYVDHLYVRLFLHKILENCENASAGYSFILGWIRGNPRAISLFYVYIEALVTHPKCSDTQDRTTIVYKLTTTALTKMMYCSIEKLAIKMIETIMYMAITQLTPGQIQKLVDILLKCPENNLQRWHMSCQSALKAVQYLIANNFIENKYLKITFEKCLKQDNIKLLKGHSNRIDNTFVIKQKMVLNILIAYLQYEIKINNLSWPETAALLDEYLSNTWDPLTMYTCMEFVRSIVPKDQAKRMYKLAISRLQVREETNAVRYCRLQLTVNFINLLKTEGTVEQLAKYNNLLIKWKGECDNESEEIYRLLFTPFDLPEQISFRPQSTESQERHRTNRNYTNRPPVNQQLSTLSDYNKASSSSNSKSDSCITANQMSDILKGISNNSIIFIKTLKKSIDNRYEHTYTFKYSADVAFLQELKNSEDALYSSD